MARHGLGALLLFYDENMRYVSSTLTPGWNRLKPGLRYVVLSGARSRSSTNRAISASTSRCTARGSRRRTSATPTSGSRARPARQPSSRSTKFTNALRARSRGRGRPRAAARRRLRRHQHDPGVREARHRLDRRHDPDDGGPGDQEPRRDQGASRSSARSATRSTTSITQFLKPGLTENEVAAFGFEYLYSSRAWRTSRTSSSPPDPNAWPNWRNFSDRIIRPGELVIIDLAALTWNGFKSCCYRTYCVGGKPTDEMKHVRRRRTSGCGTRSRPFGRA